MFACNTYSIHILLDICNQGLPFQSQELKHIKEEYKNSYNSELLVDVEKDTSGEFKELLTDLLNAEREDGSKVDQEQAETDAKVFYIVR